MAMVLPAASDLTLIELEYENTRERHMMRLHLRPVFVAASAGLNDRIYVSPNTDPLAETSIITTCVNMGTVWALYYSSRWELRLRSVWGRFSGVWVPFDDVPAWAGTVGINPTDQPEGAPTTRRVFRLLSEVLGRRRLFLRQVVAAQIEGPVDVTDTVGGFDTRDQQLVEYVSGPISALLAPDGTAFQNIARVSSWWDRSMAAVP